jgi:hypothetical protein
MKEKKPEYSKVHLKINAKSHSFGCNYLIHRPINKLSVGELKNKHKAYIMHVGRGCCNSKAVCGETTNWNGNKWVSGWKNIIEN